MASCSYTVADNGKTITLNGPSEFKAWLVNGGVEQLYPDGRFPWGSQTKGLEGLRKKAAKSSLVDFLVQNLGEATPSHIKYGVDPSKKANDSIAIDQLDPSEWDDWDEYKTWSGNTMTGSKDKIAKMAAAVQRGESLPPVLVNGLSDDPKLRPQVIDGHHRVAAYIAAGKTDVPVVYTFETLVNLWAKANGMKVDGNAIKMAESWLDSALKKDAKLSKSQPTTGFTVTQVTAMLRKRVGKMLETGNLKVVQSAKEAIDAGALSFDAGSGVEGFYNPKTDELYIIADNVNQDTVQSVLAHELLHRGLATDAKLKGAYDRFQSDMQRRFNNAAKGIGTKTDKDAYARVMDAKTPEKDRIEEYGAYMVSAWQQNPDSVSGAIKKAIQDFIAAIRAFLIRNGLDRGFIKSLTPADLMAMSRYGAKEGGSKMELTTNGIKASNTEADSQRQYREIEEHFFNKDGSEKPGAMLAPNGKRSKLTKYQWIMVRTDNFKRFYGDWERDGYRLENLGQDAGESTYSGGIYSRNNGAAPISETGEPLVFYHGTSDDIKTGFDLEHKNRKDFGWLGDGVYVANVPLFAEMYANTKQGDADPNILPLFVAVKKPYIATLEVKKKLKHATQAEIQRITKAMQKDGFDGAFLKYSDGTIELVAFNPSHVKSAVSNTGTFDSTNPDIRYSIASKAQTLLRENQSKFDSAIYQLQDRYIDLKRQMEKVVKNGGKITANPYQAEELYHQRAASRIKEFNEKELTPILQGLHDNGISMDDFQKFLHARHAESRNAVMAERNPSQDIIDAKLSDAEAALDALDGSDKKAMREAQKEVRKWRKAKPFNGTEEERLSLSGMSNQDARDFIAGLPADKAKAMSALGDKIDRITNKTLDLLVNYGMETQETVDTLKAQWEHYVPLHRDEAHPDNNGQPIGRGFSVRGSGLKTATGSNAEVTNILAHLAAQREQMIRRGEKNRVSNILAEFIKQHPDDEFATVDKVEMQDSLNDDGLVEGRMEPFFKRSMKDNVVMFRKDGKDHAITFNDRREDTQRLAMSLKNMDAGLDAVESIFAKGTRWMAAVNTQYNIVFGLFNLARDAQGMALNMSTTPLAGKQKQVFSHLWKSIKIIYGSERNLQNLDPELKRYYDAFNKAGGTTGYSQMFDDIRSRNKSLEAQLKDMGAGKGKKLLMAAKQWVSDYNSVMENATRLSVFIEAKNQGLNNDEAASIAKNITVNFNRKGSYTTKVGALYAFFNASMQGTARLAETMKGPKGKQILAGGVLAGGVSTILGMMVMGDDEWEKIPEFVRERSLIIPTSKTGYITLPMPLGFHILPNIGRKVVEMVAGSSKVSPQQRLLELVAATAGAFNPLGGGDFMQIVTPTVMDPMVSLARNKDWAGKPIYREDMNSLNPTPGFTRTKDTATSGAKMAAYAINKLTGGTEAKQGLWSPTPDQIDYLLGQILGGTGREVSKVWQTAESAVTGEELPAYKRPLVGRLYGETKGNAAEKGAYYDNVKRLNEHEAEIKWLRENKQSNKVSEYLRDNPEAKLVLKANGIESSIRKLKSIRDKLEGAGANKQRLTAIDTQIVSQMKRLNDAVSNVNH